MKRLLQAISSLVALLASGALCPAQTFPQRPVTLVVPFPPGATVDVTARRFAERLSSGLGQRVVVDNRAGGNGAVAALYVKEARPDGHTVLLADVGAFAVLPAMQKMDYDPIKDYAPVVNLFSFGGFLIVPARSPARSVSELVALARSKPNALSYGSQGMGTAGHVQGVLLEKAIGATMTHIPYKGGAPMLVDVVAGRVDLAFGTYAGFKEQMKAGAVRFLASASPARFPLLPDLPTMAESSYPIDWSSWFGLVAPKDTPAAAIEKIAGAVAAFGREPGFIQILADDGIASEVGSTDAFGKMMASDTAKMAAFVKETGIKAE